MLKSKKLFLTLFFAGCLIICAVLLILSVTGKRESALTISEPPDLLSHGKYLKKLSNNGVFKILTLNIAHGRRDSLHQIFLSSEKIKSNLDEIAALIQCVNPDIVALQEADGPSLWSGNFSHVEYLSKKARSYYSAQGTHVHGLMLSYGTALLSKYPLTTPVSITFKPSPPTFPKGFVLAAVTLDGVSETKIVSVHLDFSRKSVRKKQANDMIDILSSHKKSLIIMGDFNCELEKESALQLLIEELDLSAYKTNAGKMITFPALNKRVDYILISRNFEFISYRVLKDIVSDHLGVICEIKKKSD